MRWLVTLSLLTLGAAQAPDQRTYMVSSFERLRVDGPYDVEVVRGTAPNAVATGDPRALDQLSVRLEGSTLVVGSGTRGSELRSNQRLVSPKVTITAPALRTVLVNGGARVSVAEMRGDRVDLGLNGSGTIQVASLKADTLVATLTGTGAMTFAGEARTARIHANGAGSVEAGDFTAGDATLISESTGSMHIRARFLAQVFGYGAGSIAVEGPADCSVVGGAPVTCGGRMLPRN